MATPGYNNRGATVSAECLSATHRKVGSGHCFQSQEGRPSSRSSGIGVNTERFMQHCMDSVWKKALLCFAVARQQGYAASVCECGVATVPFLALGRSRTHDKKEDTMQLQASHNSLPYAIKWVPRAKKGGNRQVPYSGVTISNVSQCDVMRVVQPLNQGELADCVTA